ncbi:MAG TPA: phosphodiesterase, partial [Rhodocyclaceae bacterium]|nr:phosphodiesterase [Rhodocyclaceae bacterium]
RRAVAPAKALTEIFEQGGQQFDASLVASFVHTVGVYPVGSLVRLESGHLGVIQAQNAGHSLQPVVRIIYHAGRREYVPPTTVDLSRKFGNHYGRIVGVEDYARWGISAQRWLPA